MDMDQRLLPYLINLMGQAGVKTPQVASPVDLAGQGSQYASKNALAPLINRIMQPQGGPIPDLFSANQPAAPPAYTPVGRGTPGSESMGYNPDAMMRPEPQRQPSNRELMKGGHETPNTPPIKRKGGSGQLAETLSQGQGRGPLTYPGVQGRSYTAPDGSFTIPANSTYNPGPSAFIGPPSSLQNGWGPNEDYYGRQEQWTPQVSAK